MKIAFTGSHSTGKTTLLEYVKNHAQITKGCYITEVARKIIRRGFELGMNATSESYFNFINEQLSAERSFQNESFVISDRSLIDTVGYAKSNLVFECSKIEKYVVEALERVWQIEKDYFDFYVYFPIEFDVVDDGFRDMENGYQQLVDKTIKKLLNDEKVPYIEVRGSIEERYKILIKELRNRKFAMEAK